MNIQREALTEKLKKEIKPLLDQHWLEIGAGQGDPPMGVAWSVYDALSNQDGLVVVTARDNGKLIGYIVYVLAPGMHSKGLIAEADVFWMDPDYRKALSGVHLLIAGEDILRAAGAKFVIMKTTLLNDLGAIFERLEYTPIERVYRKELV